MKKILFLSIILFLAGIVVADACMTVDSPMINDVTRECAFDPLNTCFQDDRIKSMFLRVPDNWKMFSYNDWVFEPVKRFISLEEKCKEIGYTFVESFDYVCCKWRTILKISSLALIFFVLFGLALRYIFVQKKYKKTFLIGVVLIALVFVSYFVINIFFLWPPAIIIYFFRLALFAGFVLAISSMPKFKESNKILYVFAVLLMAVIAYSIVLYLLHFIGAYVGF